MAGGIQVRRWDVAPVQVGSIPTGHPIFKEKIYEGIMTILRLSHFCRNETWRWGYSTSCSFCNKFHYSDEEPLHLNLSEEEIKKRNNHDLQ